MADTFTTTTNVWFLERIKSSLKNIVGWITLVIVAIGLLYWNEWRSLQTAQSRDEVSKLVIEIPSDTLDATNDKKLVYTQWDVQTTESVNDITFDIPDITGAIALVRHVEMYQWKEKSSTKTKDNVGWSQTQTTTYSYEKVRASDLIKSSAFSEEKWHENPAMMRYESTEDRVASATLGAFTLAPSQIASIHRATAYPYTAEMLAKASSDLQYRGVVNDGTLYLGRVDKASLDTPSIGDTRITRSLVPVGPVSLIAQQMGNSFAPYQTQAGNQIEMLVDGAVSKEAMITSAQESNKMLTRGIRIGGIFAIIMWFYMLFSIVVTISSIIPILGRVVDAGVGVIVWLTGLAVGIVTIAIAWFRFRPVAAIIMLIVVALIIWAIRYKKRWTMSKPQ